MEDRRGGRRLLRPSFHLYLLTFTLTIFFAQVPMGLFAAQSPLDSTAHVLLPAAATSLLYDAFYHRVVHSPAQYFCTMVLLGVSTEMFWEVLEFGGDAAFGLSWQVDNADTMRDIICGIVGASLGAGIRLRIWMHARRTGAARPRIQYRRSGAHGRVVASGKIGVVGAAVVVVLAPPGYLSYLAWAMPPAPQFPAMAPTVSIAAALAPMAALEGSAAPGPSTAPALAPAAIHEPAVEPLPAVASVPVPSVGVPVPVGPTPGFVVVAPGGRHAYVANRAAGVITVVDTAVNQVTTTIPVPLGPPQYLAFSPDGRTAYLSIWDEARTVAAVGVLDAMTNAIVATVPVRSRPFLAAVAPDGRQLYVPNHDSGTVSVVDTATNTVSAEIRVAAHPHWVAFSHDGRRAYTANHESNVISVVDTATRTVTAEVPAERSPHSVAVHPNRPLVAATNYDSDSVMMIDTDTERVVATVRVGDGPQDVTWAPDGRFAYVANVDDDTVSVVDAATMTVTATVVTGDAPTSVAVLPDGRAAYVSNLQDGTLTVLHVGG
jgi:YVTN family beta-propeller protein